ncbi:hypothetical protein [Nocardioides sp. SR21]|uniref:hypothetical protein n=1 Tax=Nocardioides sp. SR21 TaxID=2919501 RepID=UPI001FAA98D4|nr:hypothetical protein [Nocardioides sp. SR21]
MFDLSAFAPYVVAALVFGCLAAGLATATIARITYDAARTPRSRPVVLVTTERSSARVAA